MVTDQARRQRAATLGERIRAEDGEGNVARQFEHSIRGSWAWVTSPTPASASLTKPVPAPSFFGSGSDRELRLELLTPEREKEDTDHHGNANNRKQGRCNDEPPITHRLTSPGVLVLLRPLHQYPVVSLSVAHR